MKKKIGKYVSACALKGNVLESQVHPLEGCLSCPFFAGKTEEYVKCNYVESLSFGDISVTEFRSGGKTFRRENKGKEDCSGCCFHTGSHCVRPRNLECITGEIWFICDGEKTDK